MLNVFVMAAVKTENPVYGYIYSSLVVDGQTVWLLDPTVLLDVYTFIKSNEKQVVERHT